MIKRFITQTHNLHNDDSAAHINACGNTFPFISIAQIDADYSEIFCDMTNLPLDLADASAKVKRFSMLTVSFPAAWVCHGVV